MNTPNVSVIIPMHNGELYISRCIESVINQSYKNIEIIVVDDCSDDNSCKIVNDYINEFSQIKYVKNNVCMGAASTRNLGLYLSDAQFILFLDCDDWIDLNCIEKAINKFESDADIDIVVWEVKTAYKHSKICGRYQYIYDNTLTSFTSLNLLSHSLENEFFLSPLVGCKLFKKSFLIQNNLSFPDTLYEDDMFTFLSFLYSKKIGIITGSCLYYYQHSESITHNFTEKYIIDFFKTFNLLYGYIDDRYKKCFYLYFNKCFQSMMNCLHNNVSDSITMKKYKGLIFTLFYKNINIEEYYSYSFSITI